MQNKGIVRIFAVALILVSLFYLSFTVVTTTYNNKAKEYAAGDKMKEFQYLDSIANEKVRNAFKGIPAFFIASNTISFDSINVDFINTRTKYILNKNYVHLINYF